MIDYLAIRIRPVGHVHHVVEATGYPDVHAWTYDDAMQIARNTVRALDRNVNTAMPDEWPWYGSLEFTRAALSCHWFRRPHAHRSRQGFRRYVWRLVVRHARDIMVDDYVHNRAKSRRARSKT